MAHLLRQAVEHADNFRPETTTLTLYEFRIFDYDFPVGFIRDDYVRDANWNSANFKINSNVKPTTVILAPELKGRSKVQACDEAFLEFCQQNIGLCKGFRPWLAKPSAQRDWHAIFGMEHFDSDLKGLRVCTPARGIFGVATAGVHCNVYSTKIVNGKEVIDKIWLSERSPTTTFPETPDNCFAGAMDVGDHMNSLTALGREGKEEVGIVLEDDGKTFKYNKKKWGEIVGSCQTISITTFKGPIAGPKEDGHIEFALRFAYDVRLAPGIIPEPKDDDLKKIISFEVSDLHKAFATEWKYSSVAVMVDWVLRHNLMNVSEREKQELEKRLHYKIPMENVQKYLQ
ncbi:hypothetical protein CC79DRAFT_1379749 [Sarocladium strictum]